MSETSELRWVIVGVDGSDSSRWALEWSANEAHIRGLGVRIITAVSHPEGEGVFGHLFGRKDTTDARTQEAQELLDYAKDWIKGLQPSVPVETRMVSSRPADALVEAASAPDASVVVVGSRGAGGFTSAFAGSVGVELAAHAPVPVVVLPKEHEEATRGGESGRVVVGVDGSEANQAAVEFAFAEASHRKNDLIAVCAWQPITAFTPALAPVPPEAYDDTALAAAALETLETSLSGLRAAYPDVTVDAREVRGHPVIAILDAATPADLVVIGSRGRGGFSGLMLGSVSQSVLHDAKGPVAIVR